MTEIHDDEEIPWTALRAPNEPTKNYLLFFICSNFCAEFLRESLMDEKKFSEIPEGLDHILQKEKQLLSLRAYNRNHSYKSQNTARVHYEASFYFILFFSKALFSPYSRLFLHYLQSA